MPVHDRAATFATVLKQFAPHPSWCRHVGEEISACASISTLQGERLHSVDHVSIDFHELRQASGPVIFLARTDERPKHVGEVVVCIHGWYEDRDFETWEARQLGFDLIAAADLAERSAVRRG